MTKGHRRLQCLWLAAALEQVATMQCFAEDLNLFEMTSRVTETRQVHLHLVHHGQVEQAHLAFGFLLVIENPAAFDPPPRAAEQYDWELCGIVVSCEH